MDQDVKENLPIFFVLVLGGLLILAMSGVILYQQYRAVGNEVAFIEEKKSVVTKANNTENDQANEMDVSLVGTWRDLDGKDGSKAFVFQSNGLYTEQYFHKGSIWPKARGTYEYYPNTKSLRLKQTDAYEFATFDPPIPNGAEISFQVSKLSDIELCLKGMAEVCLMRLGADIPTITSDDANFTERTSNQIAGSWETERQKITGEGAEFFGGEGTEIYGKWAFNADKTFQNYIINTSRPQLPPLIEGEYRVGTYQTPSGNKIDVIGFTEYRTGETDWRDQIGREKAEFVVIFNLRIDSANRICIHGDVYTYEPSKLREDQWQCLDRVNQ